MEMERTISFFIDKSFYAAEAICKAIPAVFILGFDFRCWTTIQLLLSIELHFEKIYRAHLWCILFPVRGRVTVIGIAYYIASGYCTFVVCIFRETFSQFWNYSGMQIVSTSHNNAYKLPHSPSYLDKSVNRGEKIYATTQVIKTVVFIQHNMTHDGIFSAPKRSFQN